MSSIMNICRDFHSRQLAAVVAAPFHHRTYHRMGEAESSPEGIMSN